MQHDIEILSNNVENKKIPLTYKTPPSATLNHVEHIVEIISNNVEYK